MRRDLMLNKTTICWSCNREITMGTKQLDQSKPHCVPKCRPQRVDDLGMVEDILNQMLDTARRS